MQRRRVHAEPLDLAGDEVQLLLCAVRSEPPTMRLRIASGRSFGMNGAMSSAARSRAAMREHDADAGLLVGRQHGVDSGFVRRHDGEEVLDRGDAVAQHLGGADQRAQPDLAVRARAVVAGIGCRRPDVERHFLEQALRQHVVRVVVRVDEARDDELARGIDDLGAGRRRRGRGAIRSMVPPDDQEVGDGRLVHVAVVIVDAAAADQDARISRFVHGYVF